MEKLVLDFTPFMEAAGMSITDVHTALGGRFGYFQVYRALSGRHEKINPQLSAALFRLFKIPVPKPFELLEDEPDEHRKSEGPQ